MKKRKKLEAPTGYFTFSEEGQRFCSKPLYKNSTDKPAMIKIKAESN